MPSDLKDADLKAKMILMRSHIHLTVVELMGVKSRKGGPYSCGVAL